MFFSGMLDLLTGDISIRNPRNIKILYQEYKARTRNCKHTDTHRVLLSVRHDDHDDDDEESAQAFLDCIRYMRANLDHTYTLLGPLSLVM